MKMQFKRWFFDPYNKFVNLIIIQNSYRDSTIYREYKNMI